MAQKGRGIFMVYVDIDVPHVQEFNEWCLLGTGYAGWPLPNYSGRAGGRTTLCCQRRDCWQGEGYLGPDQG
jgi:hypothetical protein